MRISALIRCVAIVQDPGDQKLCQDLLTSYTTSGCLKTAGDPLGCWWGTNPLTCVSSNDPPTKANGPCVDQILAASKLGTYDAPSINAHFIEASLPLGVASNQIVCQGSFCAPECGLP